MPPILQYTSTAEMQTSPAHLLAVNASAKTLLLPRPDGTSAQRGGIRRLKADRNVGSSDASRVLPALHAGASGPGPLLARSILAGLVAAVLLAV